MENNRLVKFIVSLLTLGMLTAFPEFVSAYSPETTHAALTQEMVKFFNKHHSNLELSDEELEVIIRGTVSEDDGLRMFQHFYDPVYNRGLTIGKKWQSSKEWANDTLAQATYAKNVVSNPITGVSYGTVKEFYSSETDHSWERAVYEFAWGDRNRGLQSLGHILHLLQDSSVPDHTRNDAHPPVLHFGSPFEDWADKFNRDNIDVKVQNEFPIQLTSLGGYFDSVAKYSNNNFFSKDTIFDEEYKDPQVSYEWQETLRDGDQYIFGYRNVNGDQYRLVLLGKRRFGTDEKIISIKDRDNLILTDYWRLLSQQAVLHGAGVIQLFFNEVEKEKQTKTLYNKNRTWVQTLVDRIMKNNSIDDDVQNQHASVFASSVEGETTERGVGAENTPPVTEEIPHMESQEEQSVDDPVEDAATPAPLPVSQEQAQADQEKIAEFNKATPYQPGFGGGGSSTQTTADSTQTNTDSTQNSVPSTSTEETAVPPPIILSPSANETFATTSVVVSGVASSTLVISNTFDSSTTTADANENWSLTLSNLSEGSTAVSFTAENAAGATSTATSRTITVDTTAPAISSFSVYECEHSLSPGVCLSGGTTVNLSWTTPAPDVSYVSLIKDGEVTSTTTGTSATLAVSGDGTYSIAVALYDTAGNGATSSSQSVTVLTRPVVINEIAWAGTDASATDEWIELYNPSSYTVDLSKVSITADDGSPDFSLSGSIAAGAYYLIERTASTTTSVSEDRVTAFSGGGGSGLSNDGETLSLLHGKGGLATTTLDATPSLSSCGGWCAGSNTNKRSMERVSASTAGTIVSNWKSNDTYTKNGTDANGGAINGTPKSQNSVSLLSVGYYCDPESASYTEGSYYAPASSASCTYLSSAITSGTRYGDIYKGTTASSTLAAGHSLGSSTSKTETDSYSSASHGDQYFVAIYQVRSGPAYDDLNQFRNFFQTGGNAPPHLNYGVINWVYGSAP